MSQFISLTTAIDMTKFYRAEKENILVPEYKGQNILALCETFDRNQFDILLAKPECKSLRIYYGMDKSMKVHAIIVGVNADNEDMLPSANSSTEEDNDIIEEGSRCPEDCPPLSPLNP